LTLVDFNTTLTFKTNAKIMVNDNQNDVIMKDINNKCYKQVRAGKHIVTTQRVRSH